MVFRLFLQQIDQMGIKSRMTQLPVAFVQATNLHSLWWVKMTQWLKKDDKQWSTMSIEQKRRCFRDWLFKKFSVDPMKKSMVPPQGVRWGKSESQWCKFGFHLSDAELDELVGNIFEIYAAS